MANKNSPFLDSKSEISTILIIGYLRLLNSQNQDLQNNPCFNQPQNTQSPKKQLDSQRMQSNCVLAG